MDDDINKIIDQENHLKKYNGPDQCIDSRSMLRLLEERIKTVPQVSLQSGITSLDSKIKRFSGGELVTISGPTKHGKTLLAQTFTRNMEEAGHGCLWFTYEVPPYQFLKQFGERVPLFIMPQELTEKKFSWIEERIWEAKLKYNISCVFIDNTHNLVNINQMNLSNVIGELLKTLKAIAIRFNIVVFILHHFTKGKIEKGEEIGSHLLRDSSMVAQTSDTVLLIWRDTETVNQSVLKITENRAFGIMNEYVNLIKVGNFLEESAFQNYE